MQHSSLLDPPERARWASEKTQLWDLTEVAALLQPIFLAPLFFGGMMLTRMK